MDSIPVPLWSVGVLLIVIGPLVVQRLVDLWSGAVERRTDEALSAMTAHAKRTRLNVPGAVHDDEGNGPAASVTQDDGAEQDETH